MQSGGVPPGGSGGGFLFYREDGWRAFRAAGPLDFSLTGILAGIASVLAAAGIPIFAVSTYDTDYVLVKTERYEAALDALRAAGYDVA